MKKLGIYIHIPFCKRRCAYCSFVSTTNSDLQKAYVKTIKNEIKEWASKLSEYTVDTVYVGGGTPTCLYCGGLSEIYEILTKYVKLDLKEFTVECNPESIADKLIEYKNLGVNRLSIGVQSLNDTVLARIGRLHNKQGALLALEQANLLCENVSADIMLGLPDDSIESLSDTLQGIIPYVKHLSAYGLSVEQGTPLYTQGFVASGDFERELYDTAYDILQDNGFDRYEVSNFAKDGYCSQHNLKYWQRQEYVGFGAAAHSFIKNYRYAGVDSVTAYIDGNQPSCEPVSAKDAENEYVMLALRTRQGLDLKEYKELFGKNFSQGREKALKRLEACLDITRDRVCIGSSYVYVGNSIIVELLTE